MRPPDKQRADFLKWLDSHGVDQLDLAVCRWPAEQWVPIAKSITGVTGIDDFLPRLRAENAQKAANVHFRPARGLSWSMVLLDDVTPGMATAIASKYAAAVILTSPGRCHVWLATHRPLSEGERLGVQRCLAERIGADLGSTSGEHFGRLPGFRDRKPGRDGWVNLMTLSHGPAFDPEPVLSSLPAGGVLHEEVNQRDKLDTGRDESRVEWGWTLHALRSGMAVDVVQQRLAERAASRGKSGAMGYAARTVTKASDLLEG